MLYQSLRNIDADDAKRSLEEEIADKRKFAEDQLEKFDFRALKANEFETVHQDFFDLQKSHGVFVAAYKEGELVYWSDNKVPVPLTNEKLLGERIVQLSNGWYLVNEDKGKEFTLYALSLIKTEYQYENKYLESDFHSDFSFHHKATITTDPSASGIVIEENGHALFTVVVDIEQDEDNPQTSPMLALLFAAGFIILVVYLYQQSIQFINKGKPLLSFAIFVLPVLVIRAWTDYDVSPSMWYDLDLFSPELYAQSTWQPSLGDFLLNVFTVFVITYYLYRLVKSYNRTLNWPRLLSYGVVFVGITALYYGASRINFLLKGLVINSKINFEISNLFELTSYSFIGIGIIGLMLFTFFILCNVLIQLIVKTELKLNVYYFAVTIISAAYFIIALAYTDYGLIESTWPIAILLITGFIGLQKQFNLSFAPVVGLLLINSLLAGNILIKYGSIKESDNRLLYAEHKLASDEDLDAEIRYAQMEKEIVNSKLLQEPFDTTQQFDKAAFDHKIKTRFFSGYWDQYEINYSLFDNDSLPVGLYTSSPIGFEELNDLITRSGMPSAHSENMYYIPNYDNKLSYLIKITIPGENAEPRGHLFCEFKSKKLPKDIGFPELLLDKKNKTIDALAGYSFARYLDSALVFKLGPYNYSMYDSYVKNRLPDEKNYAYYEEDDYSHLVYMVNDKNIIVLGKPIPSFLEKLTTFSYLFAIFSLLVLSSVFIKELRQLGNIRRLSLKNKIQFVVIGLILACLILFGLGTRFFISKQYNDKNNKLISEKIRSVNLEVKKKIGKFEELYSDINYVNSRLDKFSEVFFTDISLYDLDGKLLATSRHEMFNSGLLGRKMDPQAYIALHEKSRSEFIQEEYVGNMSYLSAYVPYANEKGKVLGYLNLPYFAKQNPLENELSEFMVAIINIFVVLFALSIVAALFVSNWVTKPLKLLQNSVSTIEFGKSNAKIEYTGQDEIGDLVQEYNKKVADLEEAANQLARTERESAWRDMAKQVAHEIKNPLTPMKLSVQHFQRSFDKDDPNAKDRIARFSQTLIEQIETLTSIADEFSNFAKMPTANNEVVDLSALLQHCSELFNETDESEIEYKSFVDGTAYVYHDKDHLLRVFNNLIKNALQAIPHDRQGKIDVIIEQQGDRYQIEVKDNGSGIPEDKRNKIFVPNFTTKSKGMGLGLSMVKSIVKNAGGDIWFESEENVGTSFFVTLPIHEQE